jgi:hypothetical protein
MFQPHQTRFVGSSTKHTFLQRSGNHFKRFFIDQNKTPLAKNDILGGIAIVIIPPLPLIVGSW